METPIIHPPGVRTAPTTPLKQSGLQWLPLSRGGSQSRQGDDGNKGQPVDVVRPSGTSIYTPVSSATLPRLITKDSGQDRVAESNATPVNVTGHSSKGQSPMYSSFENVKSQQSVYHTTQSARSQQSVYLTGQNISSALSQTLPRGFGATKDATVSTQATNASVYTPKRFGL